MIIFLNFIGLILALFLCVAFIMPILEIRDLCRSLAKIEDREEKKEKKKDIFANVFVIVFVLSLFLGYLFFARSFFTHQYADVNYSIENVEVLFGVEIESVDAEKGQEKLYKILLSDKNEDPVICMSALDHTLNILSDKIVGRGTYDSQIRIVLTETEYFDLIGDGNNLFRTNMSILRIKTEKYWGFYHNMTLYRLAGISDCGDFTEEEAKELSNFFFDNVNTKKCKTLPENKSVADMIHSCNHVK